jgi:tetratricopeptide (TPR) repeat protein
MQFTSLWVKQGGIMSRKPGGVIIVTAIWLLISMLISDRDLLSQQSPDTENAASHIQKGLEYFNEAFYGRIPKGQNREADQYYDLATGELKKAITADPKSIQAHRSLARVYYVRKQYADAADEYRAVTALDPWDVDAFVQLALTYTRLNRYEQAIEQLQIARSRTNDPVAIGKLDGYIQKIREKE